MSAFGIELRIFSEWWIVWICDRVVLLEELTSQKNRKYQKKHTMFSADAEASDIRFDILHSIREK